MFSSIAVALLALGTAIHAQKDVFAHYIVGTTASYTQNDWLESIQQASNAGIDAFALNIGDDSYTTQQLNNAYGAADNFKGVNGAFKMFISFDYGASSWSASQVVQIINTYKTHASQYQYQGKPLVSTFEGPGNAGDWGGIKSQTGCFFMPDYSSLGSAAAAATANVDGLLSWEAWPAGTTDTPTADQGYMSALGNRPFMMPVSPWFYTNLNSKSWVWRGDDLWHQRWQQVIQLQPAMVEILTWNDWGESHYIAPNPPYQSALPIGSADYVNPTNHSAWLEDLPFYISYYKNTMLQNTLGNQHATFWYRQSTGASCPNVPCNAVYQSDHPTANACDVDAIFFTVFSFFAPTVTVSVGGVASAPLTNSGAGTFHGSVPFNGRTGAVTIEVTGTENGSAKRMSGTGASIQNNCVAGWNAYVGNAPLSA